MSQGEQSFELLLKSHRIPYLREYRFHHTRRWRFDFVILKTADGDAEELKIAVEIEGGIFTHGRHSRSTGMLGDMIKYNQEILLGPRILRYGTGQIHAQCVEDINILLDRGET